MRTLKVLRSGLFGLALCAGLNAIAAAATSSVTLAWDPTPGVAGYRLYMGVLSHTYITTLDVGASTSASVGNLVPGTTYYFAVTDYDTNQLESAFSGEISYTVPPLTGLCRLKVSLSPSGQAVLSGLGPVAYIYSVQASPDLRSWSSIGTVTNSLLGTFQFVDPARPGVRRFYYRLQQLAP